jgi:hypothetical protein
MAVVINGTTGLSGVSTVNLANGSVTQNILANNVAGTGPAFSAYNSVNQSISGATVTKVLFQTEEFDTNNNYDASNSRFTPTVAGYYQVNAMTVSSSAVNRQCNIYKNGTGVRLGNNPQSAFWTGVSAMVYMNGTTDYLEIYTYTNVGDTLTTPNNYFQAVLVRAA